MYDVSGQPPNHASQCAVCHPNHALQNQHHVKVVTPQIHWSSGDKTHYSVSNQEMLGNINSVTLN